MPLRSSPSSHKKRAAEPMPHCSGSGWVLLNRAGFGALVSMHRRRWHAFRSIDCPPRPWWRCGTTTHRPPKGPGWPGSPGSNGFGARARCRPAGPRTSGSRRCRWGPAAGVQVTRRLAFLYQRARDPDGSGWWRAAAARRRGVDLDAIVGGPVAHVARRIHADDVEDPNTVLKPAEALLGVGPELAAVLGRHGPGPRGPAGCS